MFKVFTGGVWVEQGGGGGGTTNYSDLNNKPQINGNTLTGNKSSAQLGLQPAITSQNKVDADNVSDAASTNKFVTAAQKSEWSNKLSPSDAYTKTQVDDLLADKQDTISDLSTIRSGAEDGASALQPGDVVSTYSASGTDPVNGAAIADAIGTLDVSAQGGSGRYISQISQVDGKIVAVSTNASTAPTSGNTACITSAAVYLALQGKQSTLTFDTEPTEGSANPVTSEGIASALAGKAASGDITAAIQALDVDSVGGDTYFLTTIREVDGKIIPVAVQQSTILSDYLTIADAAATYQTAADMANYYTKTQTDSAITTAIQDLDAAAVGGTTKYVYQISESNGKISASAYSSDAAPTEGSTKLVQSKGVKAYVDNAVTTLQTAIDGKVNADDVYSKSQIDNLLAGKVNKIIGKQLSTEDFTTEEQEKLASLENYDDSDIIADIANLQNGKVDKVPGMQLSTEDFTSADKAKLASLENYDDSAIRQAIASETSSRESADAALQTAINGKQDTLTIDAIPTPGSDNVVRSGGIMNWVYGTAPNTISSGDDLNDYYNPGTYRAATANIAASLYNCPTASGFRLEVVSTISAASSGYQIQRLYPNNSEGEFFMRRRLSASSGNWGDWYRFAGTIVQPVNAPNSTQLTNISDRLDEVESI